MGQVNPHALVSPCPTWRSIQVCEMLPRAKNIVTCELKGSISEVKSQGSAQ